MSSPEVFSSEPIWEASIVEFLGDVESGQIPREAVIPLMGKICVGHIRNGSLRNFGVLQTYLRKRCAIVQLVAQPFDVEDMSHPGVRCLDVLTGEPQSHRLLVSVGPNGNEVASQLQKLQMSHEVNEATLAQSTGMLFADAL